jgi:hypothetical protein
MLLSSLVNKVIPFEFKYADESLEGEIYVFKTATPEYLKGLSKTASDLEEKIAEIEGKIDPLPENDPQLATLQLQLEAAQDEYNRTGYKWLVDAVKSWNALGDDEQPLPISHDVLNQLPIPFLTRFAKYLAGLRDGNFMEGANEKPEADSQNGSSQ